MNYYRPDYKRSNYLHARGKRLHAKYKAKWKHTSHHQARARIGRELATELCDYERLAADD